MNLIFKQISKTDDIHYGDAILIYQKSFPANERQPLSIVKERIEAGKSHLFVGLLNEEVVCMSLLWYFDNSEFVLLDYIAVSEQYRNHNFGSTFFIFLGDKIQNDQKYLIMEVENYLFGDNIEDRKKRINFYIRNGAYILNDTPYMLPSLDNTVPTEMLLMIAPKYHHSYIKKAEVESLIKRLYFELYGKTENDILLNSILPQIPDQITLSNQIIK